MRIRIGIRYVNTDVNQNHKKFLYKCIYHTIYVDIIAEKWFYQWFYQYVTLDSGFTSVQSHLQESSALNLINQHREHSLQYISCSVISWISYPYQPGNDSGPSLSFVCCQILSTASGCCSFKDKFPKDMFLANQSPLRFLQEHSCNYVSTISLMNDARYVFCPRKVELKWWTFYH